MLSFFPTPYPDELLYGICARYHQRSVNAFINATVMDLFDSPSACAVADLPSHLDHLSGLLPEGTLNTAERFINCNTMLPLYRPFLPKDRLVKLLSCMKDSTQGNSIHVAIGVVSSCIPMPRFFRFCRECVVDDDKKYGEPYWHRCHQIMPVRMCHKHHTWLFESNIVISAPRNKHEFHLVPCDSELELGRSLQDDKHFEHHQVMAESVAWLLQNHDLRVPGLHQLQQRYLHHLRRLGLITCSGRVKQSELIVRFVDHFGTDFLDQLHCGIDRDSQDNWLSTLVRKPRKASHPIRHLLLIHFLGLQVEDFFQGESRQKPPFGRGPWPCLNPAAPHYRQSVIRKCIITRNTVTGNPVGNFFCSCGFAYARTGPDWEKGNRFRRGRIITFGTEWERELIRNALVERNGLRFTARALGVDAKTVKRHLARLTTKGTEETMHERTSQKEVRRARWLFLRSEHPDKGRKELRALSQADYIWLYRHNREWLRENLPPAKTKKPTAWSRVDWERRDRKLARRITPATIRIKRLQGKPVRITICSIGVNIGMRSLLEKKLVKLPVTKAMLDRVCENKEDFAIRRVRYAAAMLSERGEPLRAWRIIREARLRPGFSRKVAEEIEHLISVGFEEGPHEYQDQQMAVS